MSVRGEMHMPDRAPRVTNEPAGTRQTVPTQVRNRAPGNRQRFRPLQLRLACAGTDRNQPLITGSGFFVGRDFFFNGWDFFFARWDFFFFFNWFFFFNGWDFFFFFNRWDFFFKRRREDMRGEEVPVRGTGAEVAARRRGRPAVTAVFYRVQAHARSAPAWVPGFLCDRPEDLRSHGCGAAVGRAPLFVHFSHRGLIARGAEPVGAAFVGLGLPSAAAPVVVLGPVDLEDRDRVVGGTRGREDLRAPGRAHAGDLRRLARHAVRHV